MSPEIFTVGHSTRSLEELVALLRRYDIACLVDVRNTPKCRRMPHFAQEALERALPERGIAYVHLKQLGGWRRPVAGSPNGGWRSKAFQGYADHMATSEFEAALARVTETAMRTPVALMCAEAVWWRCHRMLISDVLSARGWRVRHVGAGVAAEQHRLTPFALVDGRRVTYPPVQGTLEQQARVT
jgi:uncharacterized protein (DUF488 family)